MHAYVLAIEIASTIQSTYSASTNGRTIDLPILKLHQLTQEYVPESKEGGDDREMYSEELQMQKRKRTKAISRSHLLTQCIWEINICQLGTE